MKYIMKCYSMRKDILLFTTTYTDLEHIMLSRISETKANTV